MKRAFLFALTLLAALPVAFAQEHAPQRIVPVPAVGAGIAEIARASGQMAEGSVTGGGRWLRIGYASTTPMVGFVVPFLSGTQQYNPVDMLQFDLPLSAGTIVDVDLSVSTSWNSRSKDYLLSLSSPASDTPPEVSGIEILPSTFVDSFGAFFRHASFSESFVVSTYHHLRGYRMLGRSVVPMLALIAVLAVIGVCMWKKRAAAFPLLLLALVAHGLYGARVDLDLARLSVMHAATWFDDGLYAEAGGMYELAEAVEELEGNTRLTVCFDSTDYFAKLLRYLLTPIPVQLDTKGDTPTHVAVVRKIDWSYENDRLKCGSIDAPARLLQEFPDGSRLFQL